MEKGKKLLMELLLDIVNYMQVTNKSILNIIRQTKNIKISFKLECWRHEPNGRPDVQRVVSILKAMISPEQNDIINEFNVEDYEPCSKSSKGTIDINNELN